MHAQHLASVDLTGQWKENCGRIWHCTQNGNNFTWIQEGTNRVATGICVPEGNGFNWAVIITFDENVHWKLIPSADFNSLQGPSDNFVRIQQVTAPQIFGAYQENSGKIWTVTSSHGTHFTLHNEQDGRNADGWFAKDTSSGKYSVYINFHDNGGDNLLRVETHDLNVLQLSNSDTFRRV